ncbi:unnamed protein product, partial [Amoebophrya sp. A25]|eukprot:GSA25T00020027001.1
MDGVRKKCRWCQRLLHPRGLFMHELYCKMKPDSEKNKEKKSGTPATGVVPDATSSSSKAPPVPIIGASAVRDDAGGSKTHGKDILRDEEFHMDEELDDGNTKIFVNGKKPSGQGEIIDLTRDEDDEPHAKATSSGPGPSSKRARATTSSSTDSKKKKSKASTN